MEQLVAREAHNLEVVGSSPTPATRKPSRRRRLFYFLRILDIVLSTPFKRISASFARLSCVQKASLLPENVVFSRKPQPRESRLLSFPPSAGIFQRLFEFSQSFPSFSTNPLFRIIRINAFRIAVSLNKNKISFPIFSFQSSHFSSGVCDLIFGPTSPFLRDVRSASEFYRINFSL